MLFCIQKTRRGYKKWDQDGLGEEKLVHALKLVLADDPVSARQACRQVFGEGFPNLHRTLGNVYKKKFGDSIGSAKKLSLEKRKERIKQLDDEWIVMGKPGNPNWQAYLTPDEEKLIASFLETCNYMHLPFNRDAFKVSACIICSGMHAHTQTHTQTHIQGLVCAIALANGRHPNPVASDHYVRSFLKRHPGLTELKTSKIGHHRAKQATKEVRDAVFGKMQVCHPYPNPNLILLTPKHTHTIGAARPLGCFGRLNGVRT